MHRDLKSCFSVKYRKIRQALVDNDYPLHKVYSITKNILDERAEGDLAENEIEKVKLHVHLDNLSSFNKDRKTHH